MYRRSIVLAAVLLLGFPALSFGGGPIDGRWRAVFSSAQGERDYYLELKQDGTKVRGALISPRSGEYPLKSGSIKDGKLSIEVEREYGDNRVTLEIRGPLKEGRHVDGKISVEGNEIADFKMTRLPRPAGKWNVVAKSPDESNEYPLVLLLEKGKKGFAGHFESELGKHKVTEAGWQGADFKIGFVLPMDGNEIPVQIAVAFEGDNKLVGKWTVEGDGQQYTGKWSATREIPKPRFDLAGRWKTFASTSDGNSYEADLVVSREGEKLVGKYSGQLGDLNYDDVKQDGRVVRLELTAAINDNSVTFVVEAEAKGDHRLVGKWIVKGNDEFSGDWKAEREAPPPAAGHAELIAGDWAATSVLPNGNEVEFTLSFAADGERLKGIIDGRRGKNDLLSPKLQGRTVSFDVEFDRDGQTITVEFEGEVGEDGAIKGKWKVGEDASGDWRAKRKDAGAASEKSADAEEKKKAEPIRL